MNFKTSILACVLMATVLLTFQSHAQSVQLTGTTRSKLLGTLNLSFDVKELNLPVYSTPITAPRIQYDNGQLVSADCETTAVFNSVAQFSLKVKTAEGTLNRTLTESVDASVAAGYPMQSIDELCNTTSLIESKTASWTSPLANAQIKLETSEILYFNHFDLSGYENIYLTINFGYLSGVLNVDVSGDENRMSFDVVNTSKLNAGYQIYYQIVGTNPGSVSTIEAGYITLK